MHVKYLTDTYETESLTTHSILKLHHHEAVGYVSTLKFAFMFISVIKNITFSIIFRFFGGYPC